MIMKKISKPSVTFHVRAILFISVVFDEILASRHDVAPIQGTGEAESGIFLDADAAPGDLGQTGETDLWKSFVELWVKGRTAG